MHSPNYSVSFILVSMYLLSLIIGAVIGFILHALHFNSLLSYFLCAFVPIFASSRLRTFILGLLFKALELNKSVPYALDLKSRIIIAILISAISSSIFYYFGFKIDGISGGILSLLTTMSMSAVMSIRIILYGPFNNK
jgi:hypothetical protein